MDEALVLLERDGLPTREAQQLKWTVCSRYAWIALVHKPEEAVRINAMMDELGKNTALRKNPYEEAMALGGTIVYMAMQFPFAWNGGRVLTDDVIYEGMYYLYETGLTPLLKLAVNQAIGARREFLVMIKNLLMLASGTPAACHTTTKNVAYVRAGTDAEWGEDNEKLMDSLLCINFKRHHEIGRSTGMTYNPCLQLSPCYVAEKSGSLQQLLDLFNHQRQYAEAYVSAIEPFSADSNLEELHCKHSVVCFTQLCSLIHL
jgi:hypothetical protein